MDTDMLGGLLEWARSDATARIGAWISEIAAAAAGHPVAAAIMGALVLLVFVLARDLWSALGGVGLLLLGLWTIARLPDRDAYIAAAVLGSLGLLGIAVAGARWRARNARLQGGIRSLQKELQTTKDLLQREIDWRIAGEEAAKAAPSVANAQTVKPGPAKGSATPGDGSQAR
jgi:uncharacterized membrane protein YqjE